MQGVKPASNAGRYEALRLGRAPLQPLDRAGTNTPSRGALHWQRSSKGPLERRRRGHDGQPFGHMNRHSLSANPSLKLGINRSSKVNQLTAAAAGRANTIRQTTASVANGTANAWRPDALGMNMMPSLRLELAQLPQVCCFKMTSSRVPTWQLCAPPPSHHCAEETCHNRNDEMKNYAVPHGRWHRALDAHWVWKGILEGPKCLLPVARDTQDLALRSWLAARTKHPPAVAKWPHTWHGHLQQCTVLEPRGQPPYRAHQPRVTAIDFLKSHQSHAQGRTLHEI